MKTLAIALIATLSVATAMAQGAKQPEGIGKTAPAVTTAPATPAAPAKAEAPKEEMKLAKKKDAPKADTKSAPAKTQEAPATTAVKADAKPAK